MNNTQDRLNVKKTRRCPRLPHRTVQGARVSFKPRLMDPVCVSRVSQAHGEGRVLRARLGVQSAEEEQRDKRMEEQKAQAVRSTQPDRQPLDGTEPLSIENL